MQEQGRPRRAALLSAEDKPQKVRAVSQRWGILPKDALELIELVEAQQAKSTDGATTINHSNASRPRNELTITDLRTERNNKVVAALAAVGATRTMKYRSRPHPPSLPNSPRGSQTNSHSRQRQKVRRYTEEAKELDGTPQFTMSQPVPLPVTGTMKTRKKREPLMLPPVRGSWVRNLTDFFPSVRSEER